MAFLNRMIYNDPNERAAASAIQKIYKTTIWDERIKKLGPRDLSFRSLQAILSKRTSRRKRGIR
jgi:hypothetical protein